MLGTQFYHETVKTATAVFGSLFNNIVLKRRDGKLVPVPIAYGPRQKWLEAQKGLQPTEEMFERLLPRMSYQFVAMVYDQNRKLNNKPNILRAPDSLQYPRQKANMPVPYTLSYTLYCETKTLNDGWQIIEQIVPFFNPAYTVKVRHFPADADTNTPVPTNAFDMPFSLTSVTWTDDFTGDINTRRTVEWTLEFETKVWFHGPIAQTKVILDSRAIVATPGNATDSDRKDLNLLRRSDSDLLGADVGHVVLKTPDSDAIFDSDSRIRPRITNLSDSDGNVIKIVRDFNL